MGEVALDEGFNGVREGNSTLWGQVGRPVLWNGECLSVVQRRENVPLTVISPSTAFRRVSLKWLTPSIWKEPL